MGLRKVPDEQLRSLMEHFCSRLLAGPGRAEALLRAHSAKKSRVTDPVYWEAFLSG